MAEGFVDIAQSCAPQIAIEMIAAIVSIESGFRPHAIRINSDYPLADQPTSKAEAIEIAIALLAEGRDVDLGLGGINVAHLGGLGLTISDAFDPCMNLNATATLLEGYYRVAIEGGAPFTEAETTMLRAYYGQGDASVGEMVGYDRRVEAERVRLLPALGTLALAETNADPLPTREAAGGTVVEDHADWSAPVSQEDAPPTGRGAGPRWDVFNSGRGSSVLVYSNDNLETSQ